MTMRQDSLWNRVRSHTLVRQVSGMMALTAVGQGLYILAGPFIGRLYSPEEVSTFGLFVTALAFLGLVACGLFDMGIPAARNDDEARRLSGLSVLVGVGAAVVAGGFIAAAAAYDWFGFGVLPIWAGAVMTAGMLTQMMVLIGQGWAIRRDQVLSIGRANVLMNGARSVLQVVGGLLSPMWAVMVAGEIAARLAQAQWLGRSHDSSAGRRYSWTGMSHTFRDNVRYPIVFGPTVALDSIATLIQTSMIGTLFGAAAMGQFFLMRRTLDLPVAFAFRSLSDLFLARQLVMIRDNPDGLRPFFLKAAASLAIGGALVSIPLLIWGAELFQLFYGPNWALAGTMATIMAPAMVLNLAVAPVSRIFQISARPQLRLVPCIVNLLATVLILILANRGGWDVLTTVSAIAAVIAAQYISYFFAGYLAAGALPADAKTIGSNSNMQPNAEKPISFPVQ
jgi:O-antigen/teichoic acid export membrane protein